MLSALAFNSIFLLTVLPVTAMQTFRNMERDEPVLSNAKQIKNTMAQAGTALGITLATIGQQWRGATHSTVLGAEANAFNPAYEATLQSLQQALAASRGGEGGTCVGGAIGGAAVDAREHRVLQGDRGAGCDRRRRGGIAARIPLNIPHGLDGLEILENRLTLVQSLLSCCRGE